MITAKANRTGTLPPTVISISMIYTAETQHSICYIENDWILNGGGSERMY
jgi:hypothetical protein